jgi:hypothetical protein
VWGGGGNGRRPAALVITFEGGNERGGEGGERAE